MTLNYILVSVIIILCIHYVNFILTSLRGFRKLVNPDINNKNEVTVSVIVPFRNESSNILSSLESLTRQNYPADRFEIIYVDDQSNDGSRGILLSNISGGNIRVLSSMEEKSGVTSAGKKAALEKGIRNSKNEIILLTDADCVHNPEWISEMTAQFDKETGFVAGPVKLDPIENIFGHFQSIEFAGLVLLGAGLIGNNRPVICNAANMAFRRVLFGKIGGFGSKNRLTSGDDGYIMQSIFARTGFRINFCLQAGSVVSSRPAENWREFFNQRKRWASKSLFYEDKTLVFQLVLIYFFYFSLLVQLALGIFTDPVYLLLLLITVSMKVLTEYIFLRNGIKKIYEPGMLKFFFISQFIQIFYIILVPLAGLAGNYTWKGRRVTR